ncbi:MAG: hypothetical protein Q9227_000382 [Pyrenula ochraceoflavens]
MENGTMLKPETSFTAPPDAAVVQLPNAVSQRPDALDLDPVDGTGDTESGSTQSSRAFSRLPDVVIDRKWRLKSLCAELYAHQLSRCPSYALRNQKISGPFHDGDLEKFRCKFAVEIRRNLFESFLRPRKVLINLISYSANSSAAFPRGEAFRFVFSPNGQALLALSSSRIFVLDLSGESVTVRRELKTSRRPLAAAILDDASLLAVLSTRHQANIYALTENGVKHQQVLVLDNPPRTIALSPLGTVLAAAYEGGVEVFSLAANALSTDRRAVRCEAVDFLSFSSDGAMLFGSSQNLSEPNAVVITAPFYTGDDPEMSERDLQSRMWTTQILFPDNSSTCSHATILPNHNEGDASWVFAYDHSLGTYRAVRSDDTRSGIAYFRTPNTNRRYSPPLPITLPTASAQGDIIATGFSSSGLWLYGVPEFVDTAPDMSAVLDRDMPGPSNGESSSPTRLDTLEVYSPNESGDLELDEDDELFGKVEWRQSLLVKGRPISNISGLESAKWVDETRGQKVPGLAKRLAVVAPGGVEAFEASLGEGPMPVDGGRLLLLDFSWSPENGSYRELTIEVGEKKPEMLPEQHGNIDVEVDLARQRTVRQNRDLNGGRRQLGRASTALNTAYLRNTYAEGRSRDVATAPSSPDLDMHMNQIGSLLGPYSQTSPRTRETLQRAATAGAITRHPQLPQSTAPGAASGHVVYRRPNGRRQIPHESDADNWVPPPPPYSRIPERPLPESLRLTLLPRNNTEPLRRVSDVVPQPPRASTNLEAMAEVSSRDSRSPQFTPGSPRSLSSLRTPSSPRRRVTSDSNVGALTETDTNSRHSRKGSKAQSNGTIRTSPIVRRRPVSAYTPNHTDNSTRTLSATITAPVPSIPTPSPTLPPPNLSNTSPNSIPERPVTLTGPSLHNRLNYPVPPTPDNVHGRGAPSPSPSASTVQEKTYIPLSLRVRGTTSPSPALLPRNPNEEPFTQPAPPSSRAPSIQIPETPPIHPPLPFERSGPSFQAEIPPRLQQSRLSSSPLPTQPSQANAQPGPQSRDLPPTPNVSTSPISPVTSTVNSANNLSYNKFAPGSVLNSRDGSIRSSVNSHNLFHHQPTPVTRRPDPPRLETIPSAPPTVNRRDSRRDSRRESLRIPRHQKRHVISTISTAPSVVGMWDGREIVSAKSGRDRNRNNRRHEQGRVGKGGDRKKSGGRCEVM